MVSSVCQMSVMVRIITCSQNGGSCLPPGCYRPASLVNIGLLQYALAGVSYLSVGNL